MSYIKALTTIVSSLANFAFYILTNDDYALELMKVNYKVII